MQSLRNSATVGAQMVDNLQSKQTDKATFRAVLPERRSILHNRDGSIITLEVSEQELPRALPLLKWRNVRLIVEIKPDVG